MTTVVVNSNLPPGSSYNPLNFSGWPASRARMALSLGQFGSLTYGFPFMPVEVEIDNLASEYVEIQRPGAYPVINRKAPRLLQVSFTFRVADRPSNGLDSVEDELQFLRMMAFADGPVSLLGFGGILRTTTDVSEASQLWSVIAASAQYRISDLSVTVVRLNPRDQISQADCRVTLIEDRNPRINAVTLPRVEYQPIPQIRSKNSNASGSSRGGGGRPTEPTPDDGSGWTGTADGLGGRYG